MDINCWQSCSGSEKSHNARGNSNVYEMYMNGSS